MNDILFFNVFRNKYIKSIIINNLCSYNHLEHYPIYQQYQDNLIDGEKNEDENLESLILSLKSSPYDINDQDYIDTVIEHKNKLKIKKYGEINELDWLINNKKFSLLYDKLLMHKQLLDKTTSTSTPTPTTSTTTTTNPIKISKFNNNLNNFKLKFSEDSIYKLCEFNNGDLKLFKLFYKLYGPQDENDQDNLFCKENTKIVQKVVQSGSLEILKFLVSENQFQFDGYSLRYASSYGYFDILKFLIETNPTLELDGNVIDFARGDPILIKEEEQGKSKYTLRNIGLETIKYLRIVKPDLQFSQVAIDYSCVSGNIEMVKWFRNEFGLNVTSQGIQGAIIGNHINLLKYLLSNDKNMMEDYYSNNGSDDEGDELSFGMDEAIKKGHFESVKFIYHNLKGVKWTIKGIRNAAKYRHFEILKFLISKESKSEKGGCVIEESEWKDNVSILDSAFCGGDLNIIEYLHGLGFNCSIKAVVSATKHNHGIKVVKFIYDKFKKTGFSINALKNAIEAENVGVYVYLVKKRMDYYNEPLSKGTVNMKPTPLYDNVNPSFIEQAIAKNNFTIFDIGMQSLSKCKTASSTSFFTVKRDAMLSLAVSTGNLDIINSLLRDPAKNGLRVTLPIITMATNKFLAKYLYSVLDIQSESNPSSMPKPEGLDLVFNNKSMLNNFNLIKYHYSKNKWTYADEQEFTKFASVPNNVEILKFLKGINDITLKKATGETYLFPIGVLRQACLSNCLENVMYINENLDLRTANDYPVINSSINNLEIVKYLHFNNGLKYNWCTTYAIDQSCYLSNYMTVSFLLKNRTEGFTKTALSKSKKSPSILNLLNSNIHLLKNN